MHLAFNKGVCEITQWVGEIKGNLKSIAMTVTNALGNKGVPSKRGKDKSLHHKSLGPKNREMTKCEKVRVTLSHRLS